jgi:hypothetical protein
MQWLLGIRTLVGYQDAHIINQWPRSQPAAKLEFDHRCKNGRSQILLLITLIPRAKSHKNWSEWSAVGCRPTEMMKEGGAAGGPGKTEPLSERLWAPPQSGFSGGEPPGGPIMAPVGQVCAAGLFRFVLFPSRLPGHRPFSFSSRHGMN